MSTTTERVSDKRPSASRRLLDAASELFYAEGVQSVGIDRVIEKAGVAKASLYNTFGSKEALVRAYLEERHAGTTGRLTAAMALTAGRRDRILAVFAAQAALFAQPGFRASAFVAAAPEAPPGSLGEQAADEYRAWISWHVSRPGGRRRSSRPEHAGHPAAAHLRWGRVGRAHGPST
jgi:AcrR family transcriptional regulator